MAVHPGAIFLRLQAIAEASPKAWAILGPGFSLTYGDLAQLAIGTTQALLRHGFGAGQSLAVASDDSVAVLASVLAASALGCDWQAADGPDAGAADLLLYSGAQPAGTWRQAIAITPDFATVDDSPLPQPVRPAVLHLNFVAGSAPTGWSEAAILDHARQSWSELGPAQRQVALFHPLSGDFELRALSTLLCAGTLVESAHPQDWQKHAVTHVFGPSRAVADCLGPNAGLRLDAALHLTEATLSAADLVRFTPHFAAVRLAVAPSAQGASPVGQAVDPAFVDHVLKDLPGLRGSLAFLMPRKGQADRLTCFLAIDENADPTKILSEVKIRLAAKLPPHMIPRRFLLIADIPRGKDGQDDRDSAVAAAVALVHAARAKRSKT